MALKTDSASIGRYLLGIALCLAPLVLTLFSSFRADTAFLYVGFLPTFVSLAAGVRVAFAVAFGTAAAVFVGLLVSSNALLAALFMAMFAVIVAWSYSRGWQVPATYVATQAALAAVAAPHVSGLTDQPAHALPAAAAAAGFVLAGGLWVAIVGAIFLRDMEMPTKPYREHLVTFAAVLAVLLAVETYISMRWVPGAHVWWVLLTTLIVLTPDLRHSVRRAVERAGGTVLGAIAASVLVMAVSDRRVVLGLGVLAAVLTCIAFLRAPYWVFATTLTFTLVALTIPAAQVMTGSAERIGYTIVAAVISVGVAIGLRRLFTAHPELP
ncbi:FUSC family protein [Branchiibius sp. NY16-3462-2]|uniref:FUSC family protein n=1 Tax=Branchiibius sp. NY16-3462-2 TaxID=1807500 RepID=UPI0007981F75|nr:FUSC family protein [Branchiibius sp. NY16-3462-2]KYH43474.1 hypothetical protein AZH51_17140 [Branchiibius sp. NY16-3462-2]